MSRRKLIVVIAVIAGLVVVAILTIQRSKSPDDTSYEYRDSDTGEVISVTPGVSKERFGAADTNTMIIGLSGLGNFGSVGLSQNQLPIFRDDLEKNGIKTVGSYEPTVKILNPSFNTLTTRVEAELLYRKGTKPAVLLFDIKDDYEFRYKILVDGAEVYDSGALFTDNIGDFPPEDELAD